MFDPNTLLTPRILREFVPTFDSNISHWRQLAEDNSDMAAVLPGKPSSSGKPRLFTPIQAALAALMADLIRVDVKAPLAARIARRVNEANQQHPAVEQWSVVLTANGNVSTLPFDQAKLSTGQISGAPLTFAFVVDLKNYADRVAAAIAAAPKVLGGDDD